MTARADLDFCEIEIDVGRCTVAIRPALLPGRAGLVPVIVDAGSGPLSLQPSVESLEVPESALVLDLLGHAGEGPALPDSGLFLGSHLIRQVV